MKVFFQMIRYGMVGATATLVDYAAYYWFTRALGMGVWWANLAAYCVGNVVSFLGHRFITFRSHGTPLSEYAKFAAVTVAGLAISQVTVVGLVWLSVNDLLAKAAGVAVSGFFNYLANRFWTFTKLQEKAP